MDVERTINAILNRKGYLLKYEETLPSSSEDMYELKVWIEDRDATPYYFRSIFVRGAENPKKIAFDKLINMFIESYYADLWTEKD